MCKHSIVCKGLVTPQMVRVRMDVDIELSVLRTAHRRGPHPALQAGEQRSLKHRRPGNTFWLHPPVPVEWENPIGPEIPRRDDQLPFVGSTKARWVASISGVTSKVGARCQRWEKKRGMANGRMASTLSYTLQCWRTIMPHHGEFITCFPLRTPRSKDAL